MASAPDQAADIPITTISWLMSSMPAEALARPDHSDQLAPMSGSDSAARSISRSAVATPSALAARDKPIDLREASELLERQRRRMGAADGERRALAALGGGALEHQPMRRHAALGAAGHHQANSPGVARRQVALEQQAQGKRGVSAREIVCEAVALGLGEHREHALGVDAPRCNGGLDAADVIGRRGGDAMDQSAVGHDRSLASRTIKRAAIMRSQHRPQLRHRGADVGGGAGGLAQRGEQLGLERRQSDAGERAVAHDLAAGDEQLPHVLLLRLGDQQLDYILSASTRASFGGRNERSKTSATAGVFGSPYVSTSSLIAFAMRASLISPMPISAVSGETKCVLNA